MLAILWSVSWEIQHAKKLISGSSAKHQNTLDIFFWVKILTQRPQRGGETVTIEIPVLLEVSDVKKKYIANGQLH